MKYFVNGDLRYSWFRFLPDTNRQNDYFAETKDQILALMGEESLILSESRQMARLAMLRSIPDQFRFVDGLPFTLCAGTEGRYLSREYAIEDLPRLQSLGLNPISLEEFLNDLKIFIECNDGIDDKPPEWHSTLAGTLVHEQGLEQHRTLLRSLPIIPLQDGRWISTDKGTIFFPSNSQFPAIPPGTDFFEIHQDAIDMSENMDRWNLYRHAGAKFYEVTDIYKQILENQRSQARVKANLVPELVSQLSYLCDTKWTNPDNFDLWVVTTKNQISRASSVYLDSDSPDSAAMIIGKDSPDILILHEGYLAPAEKRKVNWRNWLTRYLGVSRVPRLVASRTESRPELSPDFELVLKIMPSSNWLLLLRNNWNVYSVWLDKRLAPGLKVRDRLGSEPVKCLNDRNPPLKDTFLLSTTLIVDTSMSINNLDVEDPSLELWKFLDNLGVVLDTGVKFYVRCLQTLAANQSSCEPSKDQMNQFYLGAQSKHAEDREYVM